MKNYNYFFNMAISDDGAKRIVIIGDDYIMLDQFVNINGKIYIIEHKCFFSNINDVTTKNWIEIVCNEVYFVETGKFYSTKDDWAKEIKKDIIIMKLAGI